MANLVFARWPMLKLLCAFTVAGCTYETPIYRGEIEAAALLGDGRVAVGYSQKVSRRPTGISAWPDGGRAEVLHDQFLVAIVDRDGRTREIARFENEALPASGAIEINWFEADPGHLYVTHSGQLETELPLRRLNQIRRIDHNGRELARIDLHRELLARELQHAGIRLADSHGTILTAAARDEVREM